MLWRGLALVLCLGLATCTREPAQPAIAGPDVDAIIASEAQLSAALSANNVDNVMALYHSNAAMVSPNGEWLIPRDIRRYYEAMADDPNGRFESDPPNLVEVAGTEGMAYSAGGYTEWHAAAEPGRVQITTGQSLRVWKRENGAWRIALEARTPRQSRLD